MEYTVSYCDKYIDSLLDKNGSDYFTLPLKMERFQAQAYGYVQECCKDMEVNQEASDNIKTLIKNFRPTLIQDPDNSNSYTLPEPSDYFRLITIVPVYGPNYIRKAKVVKIVKEGQKEAFQRDPFKKASPEYPHIYRYSNLFEINVGDTTDPTVYTHGLMNYVSKPIFADMSDLDQVIVNLPDISIEKICQRVAETFKFSVDDDSAAKVYQYDTTFGKKR